MSRVNEENCKEEHFKQATAVLESKLSAIESSISGLMNLSKRED